MTGNSFVPADLGKERFESVKITSIIHSTKLHNTVMQCICGGACGLIDYFG